jgi:hypothetical protein
MHLFQNCFSATNCQCLYRPRDVKGCTSGAISLLERRGSIDSGADRHSLALRPVHSQLVRHVNDRDAYQVVIAIRGRYGTIEVAEENDSWD